jgi:multiple sugar transport system ATP-binding protein
MNFVRGTYKADGAGSLALGDITVPLPAPLHVADGAPILAGIRPEHLRISADAGAGLPARIELIEPMGVTTLIHVSVAGEPVKVLSFERLQLAPGMPVGVAVASEQLHLFDPESQQRLN